MDVSALVVSLMFGAWGASGIAMVVEFLKEIGATLAGCRDDYNSADGYGVLFIVSTAALLITKFMGVF